MFVNINQIKHCTIVLTVLRASSLIINWHTDLGQRFWTETPWTSAEGWGRETLTGVTRDDCTQSKNICKHWKHIVHNIDSNGYKTDICSNVWYRSHSCALNGAEQRLLTGVLRKYLLASELAAVIGWSLNISVWFTTCLPACLCLYSHFLDLDRFFSFPIYTEYGGAGVA
jgi:hypothetical protein